MRLKRILLNLTFIIICCTAFLFAQAPTYVVTTNSDGVGPDSTFRDAINFANSHPGTIIKFNIPPGGVQKIQLGSLLPAITNPVTIDGTTQPGYNGTPLIEIAGDSLGAVAGHGLELNGGNSVVKGLAIYGFHYNGIGAGISIFSSGNKVLGCYLGTDASGTTDSLGNERGITIGIGQNNYIGGTNPGDGNVIVGNYQAGILVNGPTDNFIQGNYIGVEPDGTTAMGNGGLGGVWLTSSTRNNMVGGSAAGRNIISGNTIGINIDNSSNNTVEDNYVGTDAGGNTAVPNSTGIILSSADSNVIGSVSHGNVISGNMNDGADIFSGSTVNSVAGNYVGTNAAGTAAIPNHRQGIYIEGQSNTVGPGNLVSGNDGGGVQIQTFSATDNTVIGNYIGTDISGTTSIPNGDGVILRAGAGYTVIGGTTAADRNIISGNARYGVFFDGLGVTSSKIIGNYIGTDKTGTAAVPNAWDGVYISGHGNFVGGNSAGEGNLISGNAKKGITISSSQAIYNKIMGNLIGTDASGTSALGNNQGGIAIVDSAWNNVIGGSTPAERNIISGNGENPRIDTSGQVHGIVIDGAGTHDNKVKGNYIGLDVDGISALDNEGDGIQIRYGASNNIIGGTNPGEGNVISGNIVTGISIFGDANDPTDNNEVLGNLIGLNAAGTADIGHPGGTGVYIGANSSNNSVGGGVPGAGNYISGSGWAGYYSANADALNNRLYGNSFGTDINNNAGPSFANRVGILLQNVSSCSIGDTAAGFGNIIASSTKQGILLANNSTNNLIASNSIYNNDSAGVEIWSGTGDRITRNSIYANGGLGIDLLGGVIINDSLDLDTGPNNLQNYPVITLSSADLQAVQGTFNSQPNTQFTLEFFGNNTPDPSGYGEGQNYLGSANVTTDSGGNAAFTVSLPIPAGQSVSATATDPSGNTSEFSLDKSTQVLTKNFGQHFVVNTTVSGIPLHWPGGQTTYEISQSVNNANPNFSAAIQAGYSTWNNLSQLSYTYGGSTPSNQWGGAPDGINNNVWISSNWEQITGTDANTIGVTRVRYNALTGEITDADIAYNAEDYTWSTSVQINSNNMIMQNVATHESGHFGGLGDIYDPNDTPYYLNGMGSGNQDETMYGLIKYNETSKETLNTGDTSGIGYIYDNIKSSRLDIMLVFDGSSSYTNISGAFTQAKNSAQELLSNLRYGDKLGIIELPSSVVIPLTSINNETDRTNIANAISGMTTGGTDNLGSGMAAAQNQLSMNGEPTHLPVMILYSTGQESGTPTAENELPAITAAGTEVYTIGYSGTNVVYQNTLSQISANTKGEYSLASGASDIGNIINSYFQNLTGEQLVFIRSTSSTNIPSDSQPGLRWFGAVVDTGTTTIQPGLRWFGSNFDLRVEQPNGNVIDSTTSNPNIQFFSGPNYKYYKITNPAPGSWTLIVNGIVYPTTPETVTGYILATTDVTMAVSFDKATYNVGDTVTVQVNLDNGGANQSDVHVVSGSPITDATVLGDVTLPDGSRQSITLFHDVSGIYKAQFINTSMSGNYIFSIDGFKVNQNLDTLFNRQYSQTFYFVNNNPASAQIDTIINTVKYLPDSSFKKPPKVRRAQILLQLYATKLLINKEIYRPAINILNELLLHMNGSSGSGNGGRNGNGDDHGGNGHGYGYGQHQNDGGGGNGNGGNSGGNDDFIITASARNILVPEIQTLVQALTDSLASSKNHHGRMFKAEAADGQVPKKFSLSQNYPNPFNPTTDIKYSIPAAGHVTLKVYNMLGQPVRTLVDEQLSPGYYSVQWDGTDSRGVKVSSGIYIYRLSAGLKSAVKKMIMLK